MKRFLTSLSLMITVFSINFDFKAATIIATRTAAWNDPTAWSLGREPQCGDTIVVPPGTLMAITDNVNLNGADPLCAAVKINIFGTLNFSAGKKMRLAPGACFTVEAGGFLRPSAKGGGASENVSIGNDKIWESSDGAMTGLASFGCAVVLPVRLSAYEVISNNNNVEISWTVQVESNLSHYEILLSDDGINWFSSVELIAQQSNDYKTSLSTATLNGDAYVKLVSHDVDGKKMQLFIEAFEIKQGENFKIYPNVVSKGESINFYSNNNNENQISVYHYNGTKVKDFQISDNFFNSNDIDSGAYIVVINNDFKNTQKLIIK